MSMDENQLRLPECPNCGSGVWDYAPGVTSAVFEGALYHPRCVPVPEGHASMVSGEYAKTVHDLLTSGMTQTRPPNAHPLLSESESEELLESFLMGTSAVEFAHRLEIRDIGRFEALCK